MGLLSGNRQQPGVPAPGTNMNKMGPGGAGPWGYSFGYNPYGPHPAQPSGPQKNFAGFGNQQIYAGGNVSGGLPGMLGLQSNTGPMGQPTTGTNLYGGFGTMPTQSSVVPNYSAGAYAPPPTNSGIGSITTSVQPSPIYTPQMTQQAVNQARATADQAADPRWQQKQFMAPGRSADQGTMAAAMPGIAHSLFQGQQQAAAIPLQDAFANQQQLQQGQIGQQQEANGLANALAQFNENNIYQQNSMLNPLLALLGMGQGGGVF